MEQRSSLWRFTGVLLFAAFAALVVGYYVVHKPFSPQLAQALILCILRVGAALWITAAAGGLGRRLIQGVFDDRLVRLSAQSGLGFGCLGLGWLAIGAAGGFHPLVAWVVLFGLSLTLRREMLAWLRDWQALAEIWKSASRFGKILAGAAALILFFALLPALAPPIAYDALVYHLALPQQYAGAGRFIYVSEIMYWGMPQTGEMVYTWGMLLGGARVSAALGWCFGLLACAGCLGLARSALSADASLVGVSALLAGFTMVYLLGAAYVDWLVILFGTGWLAALFKFTLAEAPADRSRFLGLAGIFAGMALGTKYTAGVLLLCGAAVILWNGRQALKPAIAGLALYGLIAALTAASWLIKNWIYTGNLAYPFLFPSGAMSALRLEIYQGGTPFGDWRDVVLLPWRATLLGAHGAPGYSAAIGPLLVGLGFCAVLAAGTASDRRRKLLETAVVAVISGMIIWMLFGRFSSYLLQTRLYLAFFPVLAWLAACGYDGLEKFSLPGVRLGRITAALILLVVGFNVLEVGVDAARMGIGSILLGLETEAEYRGENLGQYILAAQAVRDLPPGSSTVMLWEPRSFDCYPICQPDEVLDRWQRERYPTPGQPANTPQEILENLRSAGYTHLLLHASGVEFIRAEGSMRHRPEDWTALEALLSSLPELQNFGGAYSLYALNP